MQSRAITGTDTDPADIATPAGGGVLARLTSGPAVPALAAHIGAWIAARLGKPLRVGSYVIATRYADVREVLSRDLDFRIAPINEARIDAVNGPFVLGMDRGAQDADERHALYAALRKVDLTVMREAVRDEATTRAAHSIDGLDVVATYARPIAAHTATRLFGISDPDETLFMDVARAIFAHTFLNIGGDKAVEDRALKAATYMRRWFTDEIARRRASGQFGFDMMGHLMTDGLLDDDGIRRTLGGMFVGSIDTTATAVAKIIAVIGKDRALAARIAADVDDDRALAGWCGEALRRWPHNPVLLRRAVADTALAGTDIKAGDTVVAWTQAAMLDAGMFPEPGLLRPDRQSDRYLHFGGGLHPCAGRAVNAFQIPLLVGALVRRGIAKVDAVQWAGPFPAHLPLTFRRTSS